MVDFPTRTPDQLDGLTDPQPTDNLLIHRPGGPLSTLPVSALIQLLGGGLTASNIDSLPLHDDPQVWPTVPVVVDEGGQRIAKKVNLNTLVDHRMADMMPFDPDSDYAQAIACLTSTGEVKRAAIAYITRSFGDAIDPTRPPYNVKYDFQKHKFVYTTAGSNVIEANSPIWDARDLGRLCAVSNAGSTGVLVGYIGEIIDPSHIRLFTTPDFTIPANASATRSWEEVMWGTDCTAGLQAALDAAEPRSIFGPGGVVMLGGWVMTTRARFGSIAIVGIGALQSGFVALPLAGAQDPVLADKNTGVYATRKPHKYVLKDFGVLGQRFTQHWTSFRRAVEIRGGGFNAFDLGAAYSRIEGIDIWEAQWDGFASSGAFAGIMKDVRAYFNAQVGLRVGFWDLNGVNWHAEGNGGPGVVSALSGANVNLIRSSYNGAAAHGLYFNSQYWPDELGCNFLEVGSGNTYTNIRCQESWSHSICISNTDPLSISSGRGGFNRFYMSTLDDTGNIVPAHNGNAQRLPAVRAMIRVKGNTCVNNYVRLMTGHGGVTPTNYATNAYYDSGNPSGNIMELDTPGIGNTAADYYDGYGGGAVRGPTGTSSASPISTRNSITVNGVAAP